MKLTSKLLTNRKMTKGGTKKLFKVGKKMEITEKVC